MSLDKSIFQSLGNGERPSPDMLRVALTTILNGDADSEQISALLLGLEMLGLTAQELRVGTEVMRENMIPVELDFDVLDIVGTGGTGLHTLSISTATALVCAGAGAKIAKHGNRAASSLTGTADTFAKLGVDLGMSPATAKLCIEEAGIGFLFAPNHHPAMRHVGPARKAIGIRTLFNMLGPMSNPARASHMLLGVCDDSWREPMANALAELGTMRAWVVHGEDGLDEITITGKTLVSEVRNGQVATFEISPQDFGISLSTLEDIKGGEPETNAQALTDLLDGKTGPYRDIVLLNAGAALMICGQVENIGMGIVKATQSIDSGFAKLALKRLCELSGVKL